MEEVGTQVPKHKPVCDEDSNKCRCSELEERGNKAEARIAELELEIQRRKSEYGALEAKFKELLTQKSAIEDELMGFRTKNVEWGNCPEDDNKGRCKRGKEGGMVVDLTGEGDEEDTVHQLMVENHVLVCEKKRAETEVEVVKGESITDVRTTGMEQPNINKKSVDLALGPACCTLAEVIDDLPPSGTPYKDSSYDLTPLATKEGVCSKSEGECQSNRKVSRHLSFEDEGSLNKKMAPLTPGGSKPPCLNVIDILDSDNESDIRSIQFSIPNDHKNVKVCSSTNHVADGILNDMKDNISEHCSKRATYCQGFEEDMDYCKDNVPSVPTPKRKRAAKVVTSDTESDEDDNVPISKLKRMLLQESILDKASSDVSNLLCGSPSMYNDVKGIVTPSRRRLVTLRQCEEKVKAERSSPDKTHESNYRQGIPATDYVEGDELEELGSDTEGESLGGFIVDSSDVSDANNISSHSESESDGNVDFDEILSKFQRCKSHNFKWELEADMLSALGKDLELCMKAVCALYRQQTSDEQVSKETMYQNNRGFSKFDAHRGTELAQFLTDGDPHGDLKKSVRQLEELGTKKVELCRMLATRYSKQLFEIYKNKEDPFFLPC